MRHSPVGRAVALVIGQPDPNPGVPWMGERVLLNDVYLANATSRWLAEIPKPAKPGEYTIGDYLASMPPPLTLADLNAAFPAVDVQEGWGSQASQVTMTLREYQELHFRLAMERFVRLFEDGTSKAANPL